MARRARRGGPVGVELPSRITVAPRAALPPAAASPTPTPSQSVYYKTLDDGRVVPVITLYDGSPLTDPGVSTTPDATSVTSVPTITASATPSSFDGQPPSSTINSDSSWPSDYPIIPDPGNITADDGGFWGNFSNGVRAGIIIAIIVGIVSIVIASIWFCCGRPRRRRQKERESLKLDEERERGLARQRAPGASVENLPVPLRTMHSREERERGGVPPQAQGAQRSSLRNSRVSAMAMGMARPASTLTREMSLRGGGLGMGGLGDAPPRYEEVVPNSHQRVAGGVRPPNRMEEQEEDDGMGVVADGKTPLSEIPFEDVVLDAPRSEASSSRDFGERHARAGGDTTGHTNS